MAPRLLTPAQFARTPTARKPGASYQGYVRWVTKTRTARAAKTANPDPMTAFYTALNAAPGSARADVNAQIKMALAGGRAASAAVQDQANRQAARAQAAAEGILERTAADPDRVRADWQGTAHLYGALGTGLTGAIGEAQRAEAAKAAAEV